MNTKTRTAITDGCQEAGPFESEEAAWLVVYPFSCILSVEHRIDGWYTVYVITTTISTTMLCLEHGIVNPRGTRDGRPRKLRRLSIDCLRLAFDTLMGRIGRARE